MTQTTIQTKETHQFNTKTEYLAFKACYAQAIATLKEVKLRYKQAQREQDWLKVNKLLKELNKSRVMFIYYMLIVKSDKKLCQAFSANSELLKKELKDILSRAKRCHSLQDILSNIYFMQDITTFSTMMTKIDELNCLEFLIEKTERILKSL